MNDHTAYPAFTLILRKAFVLLIFAGLFASCKKEQPTENKYSLAGGYSIFVNGGNILVSGLKSENGQFSTKHWINGVNVDESKFNDLLGNQLGYRRAVDEKYRTVYTYKDGNGNIDSYQFDQGSGAQKGFMFYYKNNAKVQLVNDKLGVLTAVSFNADKPIFAGSLGEMASDVTGGQSYLPRKAFTWDGISPLKELLIPEKSILFWGVSTVYAYGPDEVYVGGLCGVPMYWKNASPVVLDKHYGEVWQITKAGSDVYAAGLINKQNSNSTGHTACYWKNETLHELKDNAQAYGIFVNGSDVYVTGSVGSVPVNYRPCYWKNGVRVDLPM